MTRNLRTLVVAAALAAVAVTATADKAAAQYPFGYSAGYTPYGGGYSYNQSFSSGFAATPFGFPGGGYGYQSGYQTQFYSAPPVGYGFYPSAPSNIWTGSYYVSPATYYRLYGRR